MINAQTYPKIEANHNSHGKPSAVRYLPDDYEASPYDVLCGRGRRCYFHPGNVRFRDIVQSKLAQYSAASSKMDKGHIISIVYEEIYEQAGEGGFIKKDESGRWYDVGEFLAREKVSQAFRDALQDKYKSSTASKKKRRELMMQNAESTSNRSLCSSQRSLCSAQEPTLEDLERMAIQKVKETGPSDRLLTLLDEDIKHAFGSYESQWEGYTRTSFRGVDEMPIVDIRREKLQKYRQPQKGNFAVNRSCPILAWRGGRLRDDEEDDYEPLHYSTAELNTDGMDFSIVNDL